MQRMDREAAERVILMQAQLEYARTQEKEGQKQSDELKALYEKIGQKYKINKGGDVVRESYEGESVMGSHAPPLIEASLKRVVNQPMSSTSSKRFIEREFVGAWLDENRKIFRGGNIAIPRQIMSAGRKMQRILRAKLADQISNLPRDDEDVFQRRSFILKVIESLEYHSSSIWIRENTPQVR